MLTPATPFPQPGSYAQRKTVHGTERVRIMQHCGVDRAMVATPERVTARNRMLAPIVEPGRIITVALSDLMPDIIGAAQEGTPAPKTPVDWSARYPLMSWVKFRLPDSAGGAVVTGRVLEHLGDNIFVRPAEGWGETGSVVGLARAFSVPGEDIIGLMTTDAAPGADADGAA